ncbi:hypothetical protein AKJ16_DCAP03267 [Drosera capensis]
MCFSGGWDSEEVAKESLLYVYKTVVTQFSAKLNPEQVLELSSPLLSFLCLLLAADLFCRRKCVRMLVSAIDHLFDGRKVSAQLVDPDIGIISEFWKGLQGAPAVLPVAAANMDCLVLQNEYMESLNLEYVIAREDLRKRSCRVLLLSAWQQKAKGYLGEEDQEADNDDDDCQLDHECCCKGILDHNERVETRVLRNLLNLGYSQSLGLLNLVLM